MKLYNLYFILRQKNTGEYLMPFADVSVYIADI